MTNLTKNPKGINNFIYAPQAITNVSNHNGSAFINHYRNTHLDNLKNLTIPTKSKGNENWKYTNLNPIANTNFNHYSELSKTQKTHSSSPRAFMHIYNNIVLFFNQFQIKFKLINNRFFFKNQNLIYGWVIPDNVVRRRFDNHSEVGIGKRLLYRRIDNGVIYHIPDGS